LINLRYIETLDILYQYSIFHLSLPEYVQSLALALTPQRVSSIRELKYFASYDSPPARGSPKHQEWMAVWKHMASFTGLRKLHVRIATPRIWQHDIGRQESMLREDAKSVMKFDTFEWVFTWRML
jgi:hypothetical protein